MPFGYFCIMGLIYTDITLANLLEPGMEPYDTRALVDTGVLHLCIPPHIAFQLKLRQLDEREVVIADGTRKVVPYVGPLQVTFKNRNCFTGAMVMGEEVLLGAIPLEDMDLVIIPSQLKLAPNPQSPNIPMSVAK
jgi:clan AA aspartic protease